MLLFLARFFVLLRVFFFFFSCPRSSLNSSRYPQRQCIIIIIYTRTLFFVFFCKQRRETPCPRNENCVERKRVKFRANVYKAAKIVMVVLSFSSKKKNTRKRGGVDGRSRAYRMIARRRPTSVVRFKRIPPSCLPDIFIYFFLCFSFFNF